MAEQGTLIHFFFQESLMNRISKEQHLFIENAEKMNRNIL